MKNIMSLKFNRKIQKKLNGFFYNEEYHAYTLGELLLIAAANVVVLGSIVALSILTAL